ncbi:MAG: imidazole glycerol phosphate synthase subunit HisF [Candidatus Ranarchaeia archaeon]
MLAKRIIPCLDVKNGRVVKGINFLDLRDAGDPLEQALIYDKQGADELVFLDITASHERREIVANLVRKVAENLNIPFSVGGGLRTITDIRNILCNGADKVSINTAAIENPDLISEGAKIFGRQCIIVAVDAKRHYVSSRELTGLKAKTIFETEKGPCWFEVYIYGGRKPTGIDVLTWVREAESKGAGEFLITSMDQDGTKDGYDLVLTKAVCDAVNTPVIASGGAGSIDHIYDVFVKAHADAALAASIFHFGELPIPILKKELNTRGVVIRL